MKKDYIKHILCSGLIGVIFWLIGEAVYDALTRKIWQPLGIAVYFCIFAVIMIVGMYVLALFRGDYNKALDKDIKPISDNLAPMALLLTIFFIFTGFFEFLYELGGKKLIKEPTSYVFLIDDSGSMSSNDPNCERASAIKKIMEKQEADFPYSVYSFTNESQLMKEMGPYKPEDSYQFNSNGGTNIVGSLDTVLDEIIANKSIDDMPRIMLVSDGSSSSVGSNKVIEKCNDSGISISSISFGNFFKNSLLNKLSTRTGGVYVNVENIDELDAKMQEAITSNATRNLISERYLPRLNWLYAILRILFLLLMSMLWAVIKNIAYCGNMRKPNEENYSYDNVVMFTVVWAFISILIMEFATAHLELPEKLARLLLAILWTIIPGRFYNPSKGQPVLNEIEKGIGGFGSDIESDTLIGGNGGYNGDNKTLTPGANGFELPPGDFGSTTGGFGNTTGGFGNTTGGFGNTTGGFGSTADGFGSTTGGFESTTGGFGNTTGGFGSTSDGSASTGGVGNTSGPSGSAGSFGAFSEEQFTTENTDGK